MIGPLPPRYSFVVIFASLLVCLGFALWLSHVVELPFEGYVLGVLSGVIAAYVLLHDFSGPVAERPVDPA